MSAFYVRSRTGRPVSVCKECTCLKLEAWRANNRDRSKSAARAWKRRHPHKERQYRANAPLDVKERRRQRVRDWITKNRPQYMARIKTWQENNRERVRSYGQQHHAKKKGVDSEKVPTWWTAALRADPCSYCGERGGEVEHVLPLNAGGPHRIDNLVGACERCNASKSDTPLVLWLVTRTRGARVPSCALSAAERTTPASSARLRA